MENRLENEMGSGGIDIWGYVGVIWGGYTGIMEKKMETAIIVLSRVQGQEFLVFSY